MSRSSARWTILVSLFAASGSALVLIFLLAIATNNRALYERHYEWLQWLNIGVTTVLGLVIFGALARLAARMRHGKFGSRLLLKLAAIFAFVGVLPGALIYGVSYQFVSRSIESWFDVQVEGALEAGLNLGRSTLQLMVNDVSGRTRLAAERAAESPDRLQVLALERLREQTGAQTVAVLSANGQILSVAGGSLGASFLPERPAAALIKQARAGRVVAQLEGLDEESPRVLETVRPKSPAPLGTATSPERAARIRALAWVPSNSFALGNDERFLQVTVAVPAELAANALSVQQAYSEYQQRALGREGLRKMYIGTLTLTLILAVFSALVMAAVLGHQIGRPLVVLAEGVRQVARGDLRPTEVFASRDELGGLTRSFADMTQQLADARGLAQRSLAEVESAQTHLQTILDNLTAGVIVFDAQGLIETVNPGATRILRVPLSAWRGKPMGEVPGLAELARWVDQRFLAHSREVDLQDLSAAREHEQWQDSIEQPAGNEQVPLTLLVRGAPLPDGARLLVFDDISDIVSAQRSVAWAEVARRLAHEIKNPLTPIQLSAERMQHKLEAKLQGADQQMLVRSVGTIVNQVQAMKQLVNEFRDYARLPAARLEALDLNGLVGDVLTLYAHEQEAGRLHARLEPRLPQIEGDGSQLRQVVHNLVQNALDAIEDRPDGRVDVRTDVAFEPDGRVRAVRLRVIDNGPGFSDKLLKRAFEPYVTTKARGTGLGLAVVKKIVEEHGATIRVRNLQDQPSAFAPLNESDEAPRTGAQVSISFSRWIGATPSDPSRGPSARIPA